MSVSEVMAGFTWIRSVLIGDSTLSGYAPGGVWRGMAPPGTSTPYVIMSHQSGTDVTTINAFRLMDDLVYQVAVIGPAASTAMIANAAQRIDALIGSPPTSGSVTGAAILSSYRQSPLMVDELVDGELWSRIGGLYRLQVEQSS